MDIYTAIDINTTRYNLNINKINEKIRLFVGPCNIITVHRFAITLYKGICYRRLSLPFRCPIFHYTFYTNKINGTKSKPTSRRGNNNAIIITVCYNYNYGVNKKY